MNNTKPATMPHFNGKLPLSCVGWWDSVIGLTAVLITFFYLRFLGFLTSAELALSLIAVNALVIGGIEIRRAPWRKRPPSSEPFIAIAKRSSVKLIGFFLSVGVVGFLYWLFPEYRKPYYNSYFEAVFLLLPWLLPVSIAYFLYAEWRIPQEKDGCWYAGLLVLGQWRKIDYYKLKQHALGWLVKGYFMAIMFGDLANEIPSFRWKNWNLLELPFMEVYKILYTSSLSFELVFVAAGYLLSCRVLNSQIKSVENTLYGWVIAVISYAPFLSLIYVQYFGYRTSYKWSDWLVNNEPLAILWGSTILVLMVVHTWCDACFGVRFSNLTNRGIITNGAYRFCKHPAYIIKNIRWWMVAVPFAGTVSWDESFRLCLLLVCVNIVYTLRSFAEEKLLSQDPTYVAYGLWVDKHGVFNWLGNIFPRLKYENRLKKWLENGELKILPKEHFL